MCGSAKMRGKGAPKKKRTAAGKLFEVNLMWHTILTACLRIKEEPEEEAIGRNSHFLLVYHGTRFLTALGRRYRAFSQGYQEESYGRGHPSSKTWMLRFHRDSWCIDI